MNSNHTHYHPLNHWNWVFVDNEKESEDDKTKKFKELLDLLNLPDTCYPLNKKTKLFVQNFIKQNGGIDFILDEAKKQQSK